MKLRLFQRAIIAPLLAAFLICGSAWALSTNGVSGNQILNSRTFVDISEKALPAVVSIEVKKTVGKGMSPGRRSFKNEEELRKYFEKRGFGDEGDPFLPFLFPFFDREREEFEIPAAGSGVIIRPEGYIVTNYHVIAGANEGSVSVKFNDDRIINGDKVKIIGEDKFTDLAIIKVEADDDLPYLELADSSKLEIGEWVLAVGSPLELKGSVTQGIISAKNRVIGKSVIEDLIQTTAVINPGNSGGPLVNLDGKIVGINTAIASNTGRWQGVGFSIPSNTVKNISESIIEKGRATHGWLGVYMAEIDESVKEYYDLEDVQGIVVSKVIEDSPAEKAGIKAYDVITGVDGEEIKNRLEMVQNIASKRAGSEVVLSLIRPDGDEIREMEIEVTLGDRPEKVGVETEGESGREEEEAPEEYQDMGLIFDEDSLDDDEDGVRIVKVKEESPAAEAGLRRGDVIREINRMKVNSLKDYRKALAKAKRGRDHLVMYERNDEIFFSTMKRD